MGEFSTKEKLNDESITQQHSNKKLFIPSKEDESIFIPTNLNSNAKNSKSKTKNGLKKPKNPTFISDWLKTAVPAILVGAKQKSLPMKQVLNLIIQAYAEQGPNAKEKRPASRIVQPNKLYRLFNEHALIKKGKDNKPLYDADGNLQLVLTPEKIKKLNKEGIYIEALLQEEHTKKDGKKKKNSPTFVYKSPVTSTTHHIEVLKSRWNLDLLKENKSPQQFSRHLYRSGYATAGKNTPKDRSDDYDVSFNRLIPQVKRQLLIYLNTQTRYWNHRIKTTENDIVTMKSRLETLAYHLEIRNSLEGIGEGSYLMEEQVKTLERSILSAIKKLNHWQYNILLHKELETAIHKNFN